MGTKLKIAIESKILDYLGIDLVAMCVNDILANGGEPLFFLDYFSSSKISSVNFLKIIKSINDGCKQSGCSLIGGETAEMPGMYSGEDFDLAGFAVGVVERRQLLNVNNVKNGDILIGIKSNGVHSNGFSLIRKALKTNRITVDSKLPFDSTKTVGEELLIPTKIYVNELLPLIKKELINSIAHITGGGIFENLSRVIPNNLKGVIKTKDFKIPEIFHWLKKLAKISSQEMLTTFNCGIGVIIIIKKVNYKKVLNYLKKNKVEFCLLGEIENNSKNLSKVEIRKFGEWDIN